MLGSLQLKLIAAAVAAALVGGVWLYVKGLRADNERLTTENAVMSQKLTEQNEAIETWKKESDARLAAAQEQLEKAMRETADAKRRAQSIFRAKPSTPGDACKSALDLINGGVK